VHNLHTVSVEVINGTGASGVNQCMRDFITQPLAVETSGISTSFAIQSVGKCYYLQHKPRATGTQPLQIRDTSFIYLDNNRVNNFGCHAI